MKKTFIIFPIITILNLWGGMVAHAQDCGQQILKNINDDVDFDGNAANIRMELTLFSAEKCPPYFKWGDPAHSDIEVKNYPVILKVFSDEEEIYIPLSAYIDLVNITKTRIFVGGDHNDIILTISGGHSVANKYETKIFIKNIVGSGFVVIRVKKYSTVFPDTGFEETFYSQPIVN